ncbi:MAG: VOC family protein [Sciscionella sp.]
MPITRLNHAVLYVRDVGRSSEFYTGVLGFSRVDMTPENFGGAVFLRAPGSENDHDLGLFEIGDAAADSPAGRSAVGLYHLAWEIDTLDELERLRRMLSEHGFLAGASDHGTTKSLYGRDPDGLEFEIAWLVPTHALDDAAFAARKQVRPLDLEREKQRYGAATPGGTGRG